MDFPELTRDERDGGVVFPESAMSQRVENDFNFVVDVAGPPRRLDENFDAEIFPRSRRTDSARGERDEIGKKFRLLRDSRTSAFYSPETVRGRRRRGDK